MAITYTNNAKAVSDGLKKILLDEFTATAASPNIDIVIDSKFDSGRLARKGEYIRIGLEGSSFISSISDGEDRDYNFTINYYLDSYKQKQREWEDYLSDRMEHIRKLIKNNEAYTSSGTYVWHEATIDNISKPMDITEAEDIEDEGLENIRVIKMDVKITRGNFA